MDSVHHPAGDSRGEPGDCGFALRRADYAGHGRLHDAPARLPHGPDGFMAPMGAPLAGDSFAGERERNSLELLQLSPIAPAKLFWGKLFAILPFPLVFALLAQLGYWFSHSEITVTAAVASMLGALSAVLLTTAFSLMVSLRVKTVRAATHMTLFFIIPLLLLVQLGHEVFLSNLFVPLATFIVSVLVSLAVTFAGMKKFVSL